MYRDLRALVRELTRAPRRYVLLAMLAFTGLYGGLQLLRYEAFETFAWDMGLSNQAYYTTFCCGRFFYYTADLPSGFSGSLALGTHFSPILLALLPFYALAPGPPTLILLSWAVLASAAVPLYALAAHELGSERHAAAVSVLYLASPVVAMSNWFDFHPEVFIPVVVLSALYFFRTRRPIPFLLAWTVGLFITEGLIPLLGIFAFCALLGTVWRGDRDWPTRIRFLSSERRVALLALGMTLIGTVGAYLVIQSQNPSGGSFGGGYASYYHVLGASSLLWVVPTALLHPAQAWTALSYQGGLKALFVVVTLATVGFLVLLAEARYLLPFVAWTGLLLLSNFSPYYEFGDQYSLYLLPFLFAGGLSGYLTLRRVIWPRLQGWAQGRRPLPLKADSPTALAGPSLELERARRRLRLPGRLRRMEVGTTFVIVLLVGVVLTSLVESPLQGRPYEALEFTTYGLPTVTAHDQLLQQVLGEIPAGASVLTTTSIFPELSSRLNAYVLPITSYFHGNLTFTNVLDTDLNHSTYVVFDCYLDHFDCWILQALAHLSTHAPPFGLLVEEQGIYVFEQGYVGTPRTWVPYSVTLPGWDLRNPHYAEYSVPEGSGGPGLGVPSGLSPGATGLLYGPDLPYLPPGTYQLTFTLTNAGSGSPLTFEAFEQPVNVSVVPTNVSPGGHDYAVEESLGEMQAVGSATSGGEGESTATLNVPWEDPAVLWVNGQEGPSPVGFVLSSFTVTQLSY